MWAEKTTVAGSDLLADLTWGTHLCLFYRSKQELTDILVPYFKTGLENNELCVWVTSEPLDAEIALSQAVEDLADRMQNGQMEISLHTSWYAGCGTFQPDKVLRRWLKMERRAARRGFEGLRIAGDTSWIRKADWNAFIEYEAEANRLFSTRRAIAVCTYPLEGRAAAEIVDVVSKHQASVVQRDGDWEIVECICSKRADEALDCSRREWDATFDAMLDGVFLLDLESRVLRCNRAAEEWTGMPPDHIVGKKCCELVHGSDAPLPGCPLNKMLSTRRRETAELQTPDGDRWVQITVDPVHDQQGQLTAAVHVIRDVTRRKMAEIALKESESRLRTITQNAPDFIVELDRAGKVTFINRATADPATGEAVGSDWLDWIDVGYRERAKDALQRVFETAQLQEVETKVAGTDHRVTRWHANRIGPVLVDGRVESAIVIAMDVTDRKRAEEALESERHRLFSVLDELPGFVCLLARDGTVRFANRHYREQFGDPQRGGGHRKSPWDDGESRTARPTFRVFDTEIPQVWEWSEAPGRRSYQIYDYPFTDTDGSLLVLELGIDITDRKRAEEAASLTSQKLRTVFDAI